MCVLYIGKNSLFEKQMNMLPQISIIIPVYNVERYIAECLQSVMQQTCTGKIECLLVDDCGKDNSIAVAEDLIHHYDGAIQFKILHHEHNKGLSAARNTGIREAKGEYVYFLDSDDKLYDGESMARLLSLANKYPDADIIQGNTTPILEYSENQLPAYSNNREWIRQGFCTLQIPDSACNRLVKRDFITSNNIFFAEGYLQEDTIWSYQIQKRISSIAFNFKYSYWYRYNPEGIMQGMSRQREAKSFARVFNYVLNDLIKCDKIEPYEIKYLIWNARRVYGYVGRKEAIKLLATQKNRRFNLVVDFSKGLSRIRPAWLRNGILSVIRTCILEPNIQRLCDKDVLMKNYVNIDFSQPV